MEQDKKAAYLQAIHGRYRGAKRKLKQQILDEFCAVCGYHRKYAIHLLSRPVFVRRKPLRKTGLSKRGRKPIYNTPALIAALEAIWKATGYLCGKTLKSAIPLWLPHYPLDSHLSSDLDQQLLTISPATIESLLRPCKAKRQRKAPGGTKPGRLIKQQIPIRSGVWDESRPGFMEADTVAHCGQSLAGDFVWSLTLTDIATTWTENRAIWGKGAIGVCQQVESVEKNLPFPLLGFDSDGGSEFINYHFVRYFTERPEEHKVLFTRSRPYHKNDNAHVEQKNWTHVRQVFGYQRFDNKQLVDLMNDLFSKEWALYQNHFIPSMKCLEKIKIKSKYRKIYDSPQTPFQRLIQSKHIDDDKKQRLWQQHNKLNPFELKNNIDKKLNLIFNCVKVNDKFEATMQI